MGEVPKIAEAERTACRGTGTWFDAAAWLRLLTRRRYRPRIVLDVASVISVGLATTRGAQAGAVVDHPFAQGNLAVQVLELILQAFDFALLGVGQVATLFVGQIHQRFAGRNQLVLPCTMRGDHGVVAIENRQTSQGGVAQQGINRIRNLNGLDTVVNRQRGDRRARKQGNHAHRNRTTSHLVSFGKRGGQLAAMTRKALRPADGLSGVRPLLALRA
jgi:hypothetical protein